jgi:hypothetical protein
LPAKIISTMELPKDITIIASDVSGERDGIGVEIYRNDELLVEIFRDDTKLTRTVTLFKQDISLDLIQESIEIFKKEIPWDFINYNNLTQEDI